MKHIAKTLDLTGKDASLLVDKTLIGGLVSFKVQSLENQDKNLDSLIHTAAEITNKVRSNKTGTTAAAFKSLQTDKFEELFHGLLQKAITKHDVSTLYNIFK